jgi:hypothetical protein
MVPDTYLYWMAAAVLISSTALLLQAVAAWRAAKSLRRMEERLMPLAGQVEEFLGSARESLSAAAADIHSVTAKASTVLDAAQAEVEAMTAVREQVGARIGLQLQRIESVIDTTVDRFEDLVEGLRCLVMRPAREIGAVLSGFRAGFLALFGGGHGSAEDDAGERKSRP